jgi:hypothetical protein
MPGLTITEGFIMTEVRPTEEDLLRPPTKWYYNLLNKQVTTEPGQDRMGPYPSRQEAEQALEIAAQRNAEWQDQDDEWNGAKP